MTALDVIETVPAELTTPAGPSVLARYGDLVLLCEADPRQDSRVGLLVDTLSAVAASGPSGRQLSRRLAGLLSAAETDGFPALCAFGPAGSGVAAVVHGRAEMILTIGGRQLRLDGRTAVTLVDRLVTEPVEEIRAVIGDGPVSLIYGRAASAYTRPPPAVAVLSALAAVVAPEEPEPLAPPPLAPPPLAPPPLAPPPLAPPPLAAPVPAEITARLVEALRPAAEPATEPAAVPAGAPRPGHGLGRGQGVVQGVYCKRSHFNDPMVAYCTVCGISMTQAARSPVYGRRPPLGVLVLDDGTMCPVEHEHVLGRAPEQDPAVVAGEAHPLRLPDPVVSRVHARVVLDGWDVSVKDAGSTNGTFLWAARDTSWTRLPRGGKAALRPGTVVAFGQRQLRYHSYRHR